MKQTSSLSSKQRFGVRIPGGSPRSLPGVRLGARPAVPHTANTGAIPVRPTRIDSSRGRGARAAWRSFKPSMPVRIRPPLPDFASVCQRQTAALLKRRWRFKSTRRHHSTRPAPQSSLRAGTPVEVGRAWLVTPRRCDANIALVCQQQTAGLLSRRSRGGSERGHQPSPCDPTRRLVIGFGWQANLRRAIPHSVS